MNTFKKITKYAVLLLMGIPLSSSGETLKIIQFNTWGVPVVVKDTYRYWEAMEALEARDPDIIFLQEVFSRKGRGAFRSERYPYEVRGPLGFPKPISSGIRILSKYPILSSAQVSFCKCTGADCLSKKGAVIAILELPSGAHLNIVTTHLDAGTKDSVKISQLEQIKSLVEMYGDPDAPLLFAGDLNFNDRSLPYEKLMDFFGANDTWLDTHDSTEPGYTYDAYENRYAYDYSIKTNEPLIKERIDFVLYRGGSGHILRPLDSSVVFREEPLYSDHYGIEARFELATKPLASAPVFSH